MRKEEGGPARVVWQTSREPARGRSGGPLLDRRGHLIGVCSGRAGGAGYYTHAERVHDFFKEHGVKWLYEESRDEE